MNYLIKLLKIVFSDYVLSRLSSISYGWYGSYKTWESVKKKCSGYEDQSVFLKVLDSSLKVRNKEYPFERDSVLFSRIDHSFPLLAALMWIALRRNGKMNIIDYGGSLGTSYYQNSFFLDSLSEVHWCIIEQPHYVKEGRRSFSDGKLDFFDSYAECLSKYHIDLVLLSNVLQYLEKPYDILKQIIDSGMEYILIDRTLFIKGLNDRLTLQKVPKKIYRAKYPCWFLGEEKFLNMLTEKYELIYEFDIPARINITSNFRGFFFKRKEE